MLYQGENLARGLVLLRLNRSRSFSTETEKESTMKRRNFLYVVPVILIIVAIVCLWSIYGTKTVSLTAQEIQRRIDSQVIDKSLPIRGKARIIVKSVQVKTLDIQIQNGQVHVLIGVEGTLLAGKAFSAIISSLGVPMYSDGSFYFKPEKIEMQNFRYMGEVPSVTVEKFAERYVQSEKTRALIADNAQRIEDWMTSVAESSAMHVLENRPIYRVKDDVKGILIKLSLNSVEVDQDRISVTFSLWQMTISIGIGLLCFLGAIGMTFALLKDPNLGAILLVFGLSS